MKFSFKIFIFCIFAFFLFFLILQLANAEEVVLESPIKWKTPGELIAAIIRYVLGFIGILAVAALIWGGFLYLTSGGNENQIKQAKSVITYAIVGLVLALASYIIVNTVIKAITGE